MAARLPRPSCIIDKGGEVAARPKALDLNGPSLQPPRPSLTRSPPTLLCAVQPEPMRKRYQIVFFSGGSQQSRRRDKQELEPLGNGVPNWPHDNDGRNRELGLAVWLHQQSGPATVPQGIVIGNKSIRHASYNHRAIYDMVLCLHMYRASPQPVSYLPCLHHDF